MTNQFNGRLKILYTALGILGVVGVFVLWIGSTNWLADQNKAVIVDVVPKVEENSKCIREVKKDIDYLVKSQDEIRRDVKELLRRAE